MLTPTRVSDRHCADVKKWSRPSIKLTEDYNYDDYHYGYSCTSIRTEIARRYQC